MIGKLLCLNLLFWLSLITSAWAEEPLKIAFNENGKPWAWVEEGSSKGILIEIAEEALCNRMNIKISYHFFPWKRAQIFVENGFMDSLITNFTIERQRYTIASDELITDFKRSIFMRKSDPKISTVLEVRNISQLQGFKLGSYIGNGWAEHNLKGLNVQWAISSRHALIMLSKKRFDLFIGNPVATKYKIKSLGINNIIMIPNSLDDIKPSQFRLLIGKTSNYVSRLDEFDRILKQMKVEGTIKEIFDKYQ